MIGSLTEVINCAVCNELHTAVGSGTVGNRPDQFAIQLILEEDQVAWTVTASRFGVQQPSEDAPDPYDELGSGPMGTMPPRYIFTHSEPMAATSVKELRNNPKCAKSMIKKLIVLLIALSFTETAYCQVSVHQSKVVSCAQATKTRPQIGNAFRGSVSNDDYAFSARIPNGLTGWGGVYKDAPFHGFTIFLDSNMEACIVFEIHLRVDGDDSARPPSVATSIQLGKAQGWEWIREANSGWTNVHLLFSFRQPNQVDDGEVLLITPTSKLKETKAAYDAFVRSIKFGR